MRKLLFTLSLLFFLPLATYGQGTPKAEVFGGYSYLNNPDPLGLNGGRTSLHGWEGSLAGNVNRVLGIVADISGHYGGRRDFLLPNGQMSNVTQSTHLFLFGLRLTARKNERVNPFVQAMLGADRFQINADPSIKGNPPTGEATSTVFAGAWGGGLDVKIGDQVAFRAIQADYIRSKFGNQGRLSTGLVFRFGRR